MNKQRKHYAPEEKVALLRRHLLEKVRSRNWDSSPQSSTAGKRSSSRIGTAAFEQKARPNHSAEQERIVYSDERVARVGASWAVAEVEREAVEEGQGLHIDASYINISGTFYCMCSILVCCPG